MHIKLVTVTDANAKSHSTEPQTGFRIAFNMFDTDGNQRVDKEEFLVVCVEGWGRGRGCRMSSGPETQLSGRILQLFIA